MAAKKPVAKKPVVVTPEAEAKKLADNSILNMGGDPFTIYRNCKKCAQSMRAAQSALEAKIVGWNPAVVTRFNGINEAFVAAATSVVEAEKVEDPTLTADIETLWATRRVLINAAQGAVLAKAIPDYELEPIQRGSGSRDAAADVVALVKLLRKHEAAIGKKTYLTPEQLDAALALGRALQLRLTPKTAKKITPAQVVAARALRDRLFTLLSQAYDDLWGSAAAVFGRRHMEDHFPGLNAKDGVHQQPKPKKAKAEVAAEQKTPAEERPAPKPE